MSVGSEELPGSRRTVMKKQAWQVRWELEVAAKKFAAARGWEV